MSSVGIYPAAALVAGALAGLSEFLPAWPAWPPALTCAIAGLAWYVRSSHLAIVCTLLGFAAAGGVVAADARQSALDAPLRRVLDQHVGEFSLSTLGPERDHDPIAARVRLVEDAALRDGFVFLRGDVLAVQIGHEWIAAHGGITLNVSGELAGEHAAEWRAGRVIEAPVAFRRPARYLNQGVPDFERDLALDGTTLFASTKSALLVHVARSGTVVEEWAAAARIIVRRAIARWVEPHDEVAAAIVTAVLIGDRTGLPDTVRDRLQAAGTYHVIAISGGNIAILAALVVGVLTAIGLRPRTVAIGTIAVLLAYAQVAVAGPSVWRATLMAVIYLAARVLDHRTTVWQAAALAAAVMVAAEPLDLRDAGFMLTFGATIALVEVARRAGTAPSGVRGWILASILASLAVEAALLPVSAQVFSRVTGAGPLLNLAAVPLMGVVQVSGMVVVAADVVPWIARPAGWVAASAAEALVSSAALVEAAPWLAVRVPPPGIPLVLAYYAALLLALFASHVGARRAGAMGFAVAAIAMVLPGPRRALDSAPAPPLRLTMFDVGQGEALLVESGRERLLIDAGGAPFGTGAFDVGARVLAPALWSRGIRGIDALLVTHGDPDHAGGAESLLEAFGIRRFWEGIEVPTHEPSNALRQRAAAAGATRERRREGEVVAWGDAEIRVLHPPDPDWERPRVRNDDSVVLEVRLGSVALLLTGDISAETERAIAPRLSQAPIRILKVAHHGSRTSTSNALLAAWQPQMALVSAGRGNTFGHPAPEVLMRLEAAGARVFRTDRHGQITVESDGQTVRVRTFVGAEDNLGKSEVGK